jgi:hypothetical protein
MTYVERKRDSTCKFSGISLDGGMSLKSTYNKYFIKKIVYMSMIFL